MPSRKLLRPLGAFETLYYRYAQRYPMNFTMAAEFGNALDESKVRAALAAVHKRHPLLSATVDERPDGLSFYRPDSVPPIELTVVPRPSGEWRTQAARELSRPFDRSQAPLIRAVLMSNLTASTILLSVDHTVADGISLAIVLDDLVAALNGKHLAPLPLPASQEDLVSQTLPAVDELPDFSGLDPRLTTHGATRPFDPATLAEIHTVELDEAETTRLVERCRFEQATVHSVLVAVASQVRSKQRGEEFVRVLTPINMRDLIGGERECADYFTGARTGMAPLDGTSVWDQARAITAELTVARSRTGVATASTIVQQGIPADATTETAKAFLVAGLSYELMISNLGVRNIGGTGPVLPTAVWGPLALSQVQDEYATGVITHGGRLRIVTCGYLPVEVFAEFDDQIRAMLLEACA